MLGKYALAKVLRAMLLHIAGFLAVLTLLTIAHIPTPARVIAFPLLFAFGLARWSGGISQQPRLAGLAPEQRSQALGLHFSAQFLGVAVAGALGGVTLSTAGAVGVPAVAGVIALTTLVSVRQVAPALRAISVDGATSAFPTPGEARVERRGALEHPTIKGPGEARACVARTIRVRRLMDVRRVRV